MTAFSQTFTISPTASSGPGPAASGNFVNVDFASLTGQTVSQYVWGVSTGMQLSQCANTSLQNALKPLAFPLYRFNSGAGMAEAAFPGGATTSTTATLNAVFGPLINNAPLFMPSQARIIIGLGSPPSNWSSAANYAAMCAAVATYFKTTNSTATGAPLPIYGFEVGNETDNGSGTPPSYYYSYFNAASVAIRAVNANYNMFGPVFSWVSDVSGFVANCGSNIQVLDYHYYMYGGQSQFTSDGGVAAVLTDNNYAMGNAVKSAVSGNLPIFIGEYNQNDTYGTLSGGSSPGVCNTYMQNNVGAVFNAQCILAGLNASNNFEMAGIWEVYQDSDYGVVGGADNGGGYNVAPGGYLLSKAASALYGQRVAVSMGSTNPALNCLAVQAGPGAGHFAVMLINYSQTATYAGPLGLSHWPLNANGSATINQWTVSAANPSGLTTALPVVGGLSSTVSVPPESVVIVTV
jgi:hypothetical protein